MTSNKYSAVFVRKYVHFALACLRARQAKLQPPMQKTNLGKIYGKTTDFDHLKTFTTLVVSGYFICQNLCSMLPMYPNLSMYPNLDTIFSRQPDELFTLCCKMAAFHICHMANFVIFQRCKYRVFSYFFLFSFCGTQARSRKVSNMCAVFNIIGRLLFETLPSS